jgi:hypothetical protein
MTKANIKDECLLLLVLLFLFPHPKSDRASLKNCADVDEPNNRARSCEWRMKGKGDREREIERGR